MKSSHKFYDNELYNQKILIKNFLFSVCCHFVRTLKQKNPKILNKFCFILKYFQELSFFISPNSIEAQKFWFQIKSTEILCWNLFFLTHRSSRNQKRVKTGIFCMKMVFINDLIFCSFLIFDSWRFLTQNWETGGGNETFRAKLKFHFDFSQNVSAMVFSERKKSILGASKWQFSKTSTT